MDLIYQTTYQIYLKHQQYPDALLLAQKLNNQDFINETMASCSDPVVTKQLCLMLGRQRNAFETDNEDLQKIISYEELSKHFKDLARDLDVLKPKAPEEVFKSHLEEKKADETKLDSHQVNLSITYANGFINAGFSSDSLMLKESSQQDEWIWKNKESGQTAAAASMGLLMLWDIEEGLDKIDKYMESSNDLIRAGGYMAFGLINSGIKYENDPVFAILSEKLEAASDYEKIGALMGLSFTYAGSQREDILELVSPMILDGDNSMELIATAALVLGFIFIGSCSEEVSSSIVQALMERGEIDLNSPYTKFLALGLGLLFFGKQDDAMASLEFLKVIEHPIREYIEILLEGCAFACTGNVLKIQKMLHLCSEHRDEKENSEAQTAAVIAIALISFGEDTGTQMCRRVVSHIIQYGEPKLKRMVPLALSLLGVTKPDNIMMDLLQKLSYDSDLTVSVNAIFAMGVVWSGTNNSRLAGSLRTLASFYNRDPHNLFMVRVAQGLSHMGKGLINIQPLHSDKFL